MQNNKIPLYRRRRDVILGRALDVFVATAIGAGMAWVLAIWCDACNWGLQ